MKTTITAITAVWLLACNVNYEKTPSGLVYKVFPGKGGEKPKAGEFVKFHLRYVIGNNDSILPSSYGKIPGFSPLDTGKHSEYTFMEIIPKLSAGDSAEIVMSIDTLKSRKYIPEYDSIFTKGGTIKCSLKLLEIYKSDSAMMVDYQKESGLEKDREIQAVEKYMAQKNIKGVKTKNGAFAAIEVAGDPLLKADSGKIAVIKYKGYFMKDGKVFDTNMDTTKGHTEPIEVYVGIHDGRHDVMQGWNEALPYFSKGSKGKILVPAVLAYGPQGRGPEMPAYSNLVFDIEILDVKNMPAENKSKSPPQPPVEHE
ncbi:MAG: FKBP-type peptidyl-prolyl cis-trans isomerase [Ginsengibacter sp.]